MKYEDILSDALFRVDDKYSKRQDSAIFNGIAPACYEIAKVYEQMEYNLRQSFGQTATGIYLDKIVGEVGLERFPATYSVKKAEFKDENDEFIDIDLNLRFAKDEYSFVVIKKIENGVFYLKCEQAGSSPNEIMGDILPIDNVSIASAKIVANVELGTDIETDEHLRLRYLQKVREPATSGNIYHYRLWAMEVAGVGGVKVFPLWAGNGTVKLAIVNTKMEVANEQLINEVQKYIDSVRPIGATVSVVSAKNKEINVAVKVTVVQGSSLQEIQDSFKLAIKEFFKENAFKTNYVSIAKIGNILLDVKNVLDYKDLKLNETVANIELNEEEIPLLKSIKVEVI